MPFSSRARAGLGVPRTATRSRPLQDAQIPPLSGSSTCCNRPGAAVLPGALEEQELPESSSGFAETSTAPQAAAEAEGELRHGRFVGHGAGDGGAVAPRLPPALRHRREKNEVQVWDELGYVRDDVRARGGVYLREACFHGWGGGEGGRSEWDYDSVVTMCPLTLGFAFMRPAFNGRGGATAEITYAHIAGFAFERPALRGRRGKEG